MDLKNRLIEPDENSVTRFEPFYQITPKELDEICKQYHKKQLMLGGVGSSSDLIVVELSDNEIKIISEQELKKWQQSAIDFDGFEGWIVRGRLVKNR